MDLELFGSYKWCKLFFELKAKEFGVYLWTVPYEGKYLVHYVGETGKNGKSFAQRFVEHTRNQLSGLYDLYDPTEFIKGKRKRLWEGWWKRPELKVPTRAVDFLQNYFELSKAAYDMLEAIQIFLIPFEYDGRIRKRIESAIAIDLFDQLGASHDFQDEYCFSDLNPQSYRKFGRQLNESKIDVSIKSYEQIFGLHHELKV